MDTLYYAVGILISAVAILGIFVEIYLYFNYHASNRKKADCGMTGGQVARMLLDRNGMQDVRVKKANLLWAFFWGNSYSKRKKTVFLRRGIINKTSITAIGVAAQKVGVAIMDRDNDKKFLSRYWFAPFALLVQTVPLILVLGILCDFVINNTVGIYTIVAVALSILIFFGSMLFTFVQIPIEKKGVENGRRMIESNRLLNDRESDILEKYYKAYIVDFVMQFILKLLEVIKFIIRLVIELSTKE